jgi:hypothetical protein
LTHKENATTVAIIKKQIELFPCSGLLAHRACHDVQMKKKVKTQLCGGIQGCRANQTMHVQKMEGRHDARILAISNSC